MRDISSITDEAERRRDAALARYAIFDSAREESFDEIVRLAADICDVPIAVINFVGSDRQFFKAEIGLGVRETPLQVSFCAHAVREDDFMVVEDATKDSRFAEFPQVASEPGIRFYAGAMLRTQDGLPVGSMCVLDTRPRAITELQRRTLEVFARQIMHQLDLRVALKERAEQERRYRLLFDSMDEGFCVIEFLDGPHGPLSDYVHVEANAAYAANAGIPDVVGQRLREMVSPEAADDWAARYREVLLTGEPIRFERALEETGRYLSLSSFRIEPPELRQVAVLFQDMTARRKAEIDLLELNHTLEQRVEEERGRFVAAEEALRQAQKMEAVGQLTGGLAHDFNNLLAGITGSLEMIGTRLAQGRSSDVEKYLSAAQGATRRAAALTHRLLAFARRQTLNPRPLIVNDLLPDLVELVRRTVGPGIAVESAAAAALWPTSVDANQLENALLNLCINARDAMPDGGRLTIETANKWLDASAARQRGIEEGQYVTVCVSDNGVGIDKDTLEKVFEPFFTTKPIGEGTGLGLSMVYGFARQSHGHVRIYSEVGQGTMVCLYLPRHFGEVEKEEAHVLLDAPPLGSGGKSVLVIDDEPVIRMLVVDALEEMGFECAEAGDGPEGLAILEHAERLDLLITDVGLPGGLNGRQVADRARELRPDLKVLFITGYAENAALNHGHIGPGVRVLTKPFSVSELTGRIESLLA
ncbi:MAG TPA: ATP-binding protein [Croceibacterium sp.]